MASKWIEDQVEWSVCNLSFAYRPPLGGNGFALNDIANNDESNG
jgi:hypothetical protein